MTWVELVMGSLASISAFNLLAWALEPPELGEDFFCP